VTDAAVAGFAGFTLLSHAVVAAGLGLRVLALAAGAAAAVALLAVSLRRLRSARGLAATPSDALARHGEPASTRRLEVPALEPSRALRAAVLALALLLAGVHLATGALVPIWAVATAILIVLAFAERAREPAWPEARKHGHETAVLLGLGVLGALYALCVSRPDADDTLYLGLAAAAVEQPDAALMATDPVHGVAGVPLAIPVYGVHALEPLVALVAWLTPLRVLDVAHLVLPVLAALLLPFAFARLLRLLLPERWLLGVFVALAALLLWGQAHGSYGNFAWVRFHQGKGLLRSIGIPLVLATALEFRLDPRPARWLRLAAAQVACVGASATGLWVAPALAAIVAVGLAGRGPRALRTLVAGLAGTLYPVLLAGSLVAAVIRAFEASPTLFSAHVGFADAWELVLGGRGAGAVAVLVWVGVWALAPTALSRRVVASLGVGFGLLIAPFAAEFVARSITGEPTYWRAFWVLPLPALLAVVATAPAAVVKRRLPAALAVAAVAAVLLVTSSRVPTWSARNWAEISGPGWKIDRAERATLLELAALADANDTVLAPPAVARWLPALEGAPTPLVARQSYLAMLIGHVPEPEIARRARLVRVVTGQDTRPKHLAVLERALTAGELRAVTVLQRASTPALRAILGGHGLELIATHGDFETWGQR
jgi:hypothetical protein